MAPPTWRVMNSFSMVMPRGSICGIWLRRDFLGIGYGDWRSQNLGEGSSGYKLVPATDDSKECAAEHDAHPRRKLETKV